MAGLDPHPLAIVIPPEVVEDALHECLAPLRERMISGQPYKVIGWLREDGALIVRAEPVSPRP